VKFSQWDDGLCWLLLLWIREDVNSCGCLARAWSSQATVAPLREKKLGATPCG